MTNIKRDSAGHFAPGVSANPGGRVKIDPEAREILKAATPKAARRLVEMIGSKSEKVAIMACNSILDRILGKPEAVSKVELTGQNQPVVLFRWMTDEEASTITPQNAEINSKDENHTAIFTA